MMGIARKGEILTGVEIKKIMQVLDSLFKTDIECLSVDVLRLKAGIQSVIVWHFGQRWIARLLRAA
jgi:hypothetical protein